MFRRTFLIFSLSGLLPLAFAHPGLTADDTQKLPAGIKIEEQPTDTQAAKIVLIAGSNFFKAGEHEYVAGCAVLADLLRQTPGVAPVLALDWPKKPETLAGAKCVVFLFDGGAKHGILKENRLAQVKKLADDGVGLVFFHQTIDYPKDLGARTREYSGAVWEPGYSQRAHWIAEFKDFSDHPIFQGVSSFKVDDGWLFKLRFVEGMKGVTPLLRTADPKAKAKQTDTDTVVAWAYERSPGGKTFTFTGTHLHSSFAQEGYRRFLTNGILWSAGITLPKTGAPVALTTEQMNQYLAKAPAPKNK